MKNQPAYVSEFYGNIYRLMVYLIENKSRFVFTPDKYCDNRQGGARLQQELSDESTLRIKTLTE